MRILSAETQMASKSRTPLSHIINYSIGEGATSFTMNGISNFAMLYYTKILGLDAKYVGLALGIAFIWDAITDPIMGHITDNTRSHYGRRHPYILIGGLMLAGLFFFLWFVPDTFTEPKILFWYLLTINVFLRTAITIYFVPYSALGFEICTDYEGRSRLQSIRYFMNQVINFVGGALAWSIFFQDKTQMDGTRLDGTAIAGNYYNMGIALAAGTACAIIYCVLFTRQYAFDTSERIKEKNSLRSFILDFWDTISDRHALYVFGFFAIFALATMVVSQIQMFTYVDFMKFTHAHKSIVHGSGMICFALGSLLQLWLVRRFDKKPAGYIGICFGVFGNIMLLLFFVGGILKPETTWIFPDKLPFLGNMNFPVATAVFAVFQGMWWGGCGILVPLGASMMADISEINKHKTGVLKDGSYSAVFGFVTKSSLGIGMLINGLLLNSIGFVSGAETQSPETIGKIAILTFASGPIIVLTGLPVLMAYPVNRQFMAKLRTDKTDVTMQQSV